MDTVLVEPRLVELLWNSIQLLEKVGCKSNKTLKKQAKNSDGNMFANDIFPKEFSKVAQACYMEQMDAFSKLFEDEEFYKRVMGEMAKAMYYDFQLKENEKKDENQ